MDSLIIAHHPHARLEVALAVTTQVAREAQKAHQLAATSAIALGRLLTSVALVGMSSKRPGITSFQLISKSRIGQIYAAVVNDEGHLRGTVREATLNFPLLHGETPNRRRSVGAAVYPGDLSVVRSNLKGEYGQSAVHLANGEIDADVEHFVVQSDQVPTFLSAEVLLDSQGHVNHAGGVLVQALPDGDLSVLDDLRTRRDHFLALLPTHPDPRAVLEGWLPGLRCEAPRPLRWQCRCSAERVKGSLRLFPITELAEMIQEDQAVTVNCDFCGQSYRVEPAELRVVFEELIKAQA